MPITPRARPASRYGQATLDPSRPLYVCRRISRGAAGALVPGQVFDASATAPHRLRSLYSGGYISHNPPAPGVAQVVAAALARAGQGNPSAPAVDPAPAVDAQVDVPPPAPDAKPAKRTRAGA
jgi:hypothetical protein